jgi:hypothetical protein
LLFSELAVDDDHLLAKPAGATATCQRWIAKGERSGLLTRMATESGSLFAAMKKLSAFLQLESMISRWFGSEGTGNKTVSR